MRRRVVPREDEVALRLGRRVGERASGVLRGVSPENDGVGLDHRPALATSADLSFAKYDVPQPGTRGIAHQSTQESSRGKRVCDCLDHSLARHCVEGVLDSSIAWPGNRHRSSAAPVTCPDSVVGVRRRASESSQCRHCSISPSLDLTAA